MTTLIEKLSSERLGQPAPTEAIVRSPIETSAAVDPKPAGRANGSGIAIDLAALVERASKAGEADSGGSDAADTVDRGFGRSRRVYHSVPFGDAAAEPAAVAKAIPQSAVASGAISRIKGSLAKVLSLPRRNIEAGDLPRSAMLESVGNEAGDAPPQPLELAAAPHMDKQPDSTASSLRQRLLSNGQVDPRTEPMLPLASAEAVSSPAEIEQFIEAAIDRDVAAAEHVDPAEAKLTNPSN